MVLKPAGLWRLEEPDTVILLIDIEVGAGDQPAVDV